MKRATYKAACDWIAANDETALRKATDATELTGLISVQMASSLFDIAPEVVAQNVLRRREDADRDERRRQADRVVGFDRDDLGCSRD